MSASGYWDGTGEPPAWHPVGRIDLSRLSPTTKLQAALTALLFLSLQLPWYTTSAAGLTGSASAMSAGGWRWLIWLLSLFTAVYLALGAVTSWRDPAWLAGRRSRLLIGVAALDCLLVLIAAFAAKAHPPSLVPIPASAAVGTGIGAVLAVLLSLGILVVALLEVINASPKAVPAGGISGRRGAVVLEDDAPTRVAAERGGDDLASRAAPPAAGRAPDPLRIPGVDPAPPGRPASAPPANYPQQRPAEPGSGPPTGWMPPQPPPPPPL